MPRIDQLLCTHCTFGTAATERRTGDDASKPLGYAPRAASLTGAALQRVYAEIEPFLYLRFPNDTPKEVLKGYSPATAPQRLLYVPSVDGRRMLGLVSWRPQTTAGEFGAYFAHVLISPKDDPALSGLAGLQLLTAQKWVFQDSDALPFDLPALASLKGWTSGRPVVDDATFFSFLTTPSGRTFHDPGRYIPERWRQKSPEERQKFFREFFQAVLDLDLERHESVLLVAELDLAPLIFYGVLRLLPPEGLGGQIGYSTLDSFTDRPFTTLAATTFYNPELEFPLEAFTVKGFVFNTFSGQRTPEPKRDRTPQYVEGLLGLLLDPQHRWPAVDRMLKSFQSTGARFVAEMEHVLGSERFVDGFLSPGMEPQFPKSKAGRVHVRQSVAELLANLNPQGPEIRQLAAHPQQVIALWRLLGTESNLTACRPHLEQVSQGLSGDQVAQLFAQEEIAAEHRATLLALFVKKQGTLPPGCEKFWDKKKTKEAADPNWLPMLFARLDPAAALGFLKNQLVSLPTDEKEREDRLKRLTSVALHQCGRDPLWQPTLAGFLENPGMLASMRVLILKSKTVSDGLIQHFPGLEQWLTQMLQGLPQQRGNFPLHLAILQRYQSRLPAAAAAQVEGWNQLFQLLQELDQAEQQQPGSLAQLCQQTAGSAAAPPFGERLGAAVLKALPNQQHPGDRTGQQRAATVTGLAAAVITAAPLPTDFVEKLQHYLCGLGWPGAAEKEKATRAAGGGSDSRKMALGLVVIGASVMLVIGLLAGLVAALSQGPAANSHAVTPPAPVPSEPLPQEGVGVVQKFFSLPPVPSSAEEAGRPAVPIEGTVGADDLALLGLEQVNLHLHALPDEPPRMPDTRHLFWRTPVGSSGYQIVVSGDAESPEDTLAELVPMPDRSVGFQWQYVEDDRAQLWQWELRRCVLEIRRNGRAPEWVGWQPPFRGNASKWVNFAGYLATPETHFYQDEALSPGAISGFPLVLGSGQVSSSFSFPPPFDFGLDDAGHRTWRTEQPLPQFREHFQLTQARVVLREDRIDFDVEPQIATLSQARDQALTQLLTKRNQIQDQLFILDNPEQQFGAFNNARNELVRLLEVPPEPKPDDEENPVLALARADTLRKEKAISQGRQFIEEFAQRQIDLLQEYEEPLQKLSELSGPRWTMTGTVFIVVSGVLEEGELKSGVVVPLLQIGPPVEDGGF